jgi:hypothetical protein
MTIERNDNTYPLKRKRNEECELEINELEAEKREKITHNYFDKISCIQLLFHLYLNHKRFLDYLLCILLVSLTLDRFSDFSSGFCLLYFL